MRERVRVDNMEELLQELQKALERLEKEGVETSIYTNPAEFFKEREIQSDFFDEDYEIYEELSKFFEKLGWQEEEGDFGEMMCKWTKKGVGQVGFINIDWGNPPYLIVEKKEEE